MKDNISTYISNKRKAKENLHLLLDAQGGGVCNLVTRDEQKASVFNSKTSCSLGTQPLEMENREQN